MGSSVCTHAGGCFGGRIAAAGGRVGDCRGRARRGHRCDSGQKRAGSGGSRSGGGRTVGWKGQLGVDCGRPRYLSGDKARGQAIFDRVTGGKPKASDWQRIGEVYTQVGETDRAADCFQKALADNPKDDTGQAEIGAWYIRIGQREKGEALLGQALARQPDEVWHYVRAAEVLLGVPIGR